MLDFSGSDCPVPIGAVLQVRDKLIAIHDGNRVEIRAPAGLIRRTLTACDGTRTFAELTTDPAGGVDQRMAGFIKYLLDNGVLINANHLTWKAMSYGRQMSPYGRTEPGFTASKLRRTQTREAACDENPVCPLPPVENGPLTSLFHDRVSTYGFHSQRLPSANALHTLLWSLAGVVADSHPRSDKTRHHTLASAGGLYLITVYVVLPRGLSPHDAGVYRITYPKADCISLEPVSALHEQLPRAYARPDLLHGAVAAIIISGDIKSASRRYRNRATQYLCMETGAALQNGALTAAGLGLGYTILGNYHEDVLSRMCSLPQDVSVLGTALCGVRDEELPPERDPQLTFLWADHLDAAHPLSGYLGRACHSSREDQGPYSWGYHRDPRIAHLKAVAEHIERQGMLTPRGLIEASRRDLPDALEPGLFMRYSPQQLRRKTFPFRLLPDDQRALWTKATSCTDGRLHYVLAQLVHPQSALMSHTTGELADPGHVHVQCTTSGCAAGTSLEEALERGLLELVERDAFMRHWFSQRPGCTIPDEHLSADILHRVSLLRRTGCCVGIQRLDTELACTALAWAQNESAAFTAIGCAASSTLDEALSSAIDELESRAYVWLNGLQTATTPRAREVKTFADHAAIYGSRRHFKRADRILQATQRWSELPSRLPGTILQRLLKAGYTPYFTEITPELNTLYAGRMPLVVIKALVPGLIPISCGYGNEPLGLVNAVDPDARFPHPFP